MKNGLIHSGVSVRSASLLFFLTALLGYFCLPFSAQADNHARATNPPRVLVTIAPLYSLVLGVMQGVATPDLLLSRSSSPHDYALKPSDAKKIATADVIIYTDLVSEHYLAPILRALNERPHTLLEAISLPGMQVYPPQNVHVEDADEGSLVADMHVWLDPLNAIAFTKAVANELSVADHARAARYQANAAKQIKKLEALHQKVSALFCNKQNCHSRARYATYHSVLQYFERRYRIVDAYVITSHHESGMSLSELGAFEHTLKEGEINCLFNEVDFAPKQLTDLAKRSGRNIRFYAIDELGSRLPLDANLYPALIWNIAKQIKQCVTRATNHE